MPSVGERVKERRASLGISQRDLAQSVGITQQAIEKLEADKVKDPKHIVEIAGRLGVTPQWLKSGREPRFPAPEDAPEFSGAIPPPAAYSIRTVREGYRVVEFIREIPEERILRAMELLHELEQLARDNGRT